VGAVAFIVSARLKPTQNRIRMPRGAAARAQA